MLHRVAWYKFTEVSEVLVASVIRAMIEVLNAGCSRTRLVIRGKEKFRKK
jgi:hypothetical protein